MANQTTAHHENTIRITAVDSRQNGFPGASDNHRDPFRDILPACLPDIPDRGAVSLSGMYQVAASNDPLFPMDRGQEWFLDFGKGIHDGINGGKVAVSLRQNPKVSVSIMVWQYAPRERALYIGNQAAAGSGRAVARGVWALDIDSGAVFLLRGKCTIVLKRADPSDY